MGKKILLADDSITIQKVIELTFSDEDFEVVSVGNGRLAIEKVQELRPDIVLCDIIMPEKDGYEVCEFIKKTPALTHVPVLLLTGAFEPFDQERAARAGCDGFLAKPFEPQTLIAKVKDLLGQAAARPAVPAPPPAAITPPPVTFAPPPSTSFAAPPAPPTFGSTLPPTPPPPPPAMPEPAMTYLAEETPPNEAPLGFADVMDTTPPPQDTFEDPTLDPATFGSHAEETAAEDLLAVTPEEQATLEPPQQTADSSSTVMFQAPAWTPPTLEVSLEERAQASVESAGDVAMFEEVFEEDLSAVPPLQAAPAPGVAPTPEPMLEEPMPQEPAAATSASAMDEAEDSFSDLADEPPPVMSEAAEVAVPVDQVAQIAQRVVGQISEKVIREIAWEVIPDLAEALIRKEIERLKAELQQS